MYDFSFQVIICPSNAQKTSVDSIRFALKSVHNFFNSASYLSCEPIQYQIIVPAFLIPTARQPRPTRTENIGSVE